MLINYGCEIGISVPRATPLICLLDVHPERRKDISSEAPFKTRPPTQAMMYLDGFGNQCRRLMVPSGNITLRLDGTILDSGKPDEVAPDAREVPVEMLPHYLLGFLLGSRYCETDRLGQVAWDLFGGVEPGWTRVQAVCDFVHKHLTFGYPHARATRTALEAYEEKKGVCRDFAHLMIALCRCLNIPARYVTATSATSACRRIRRPWTSAPGWRCTWRTAGSRSMPVTTSGASGALSSPAAATPPTYR